MAIEPLFVSELFYSIQGESTRAGLPCCFIRLSGCNLRCRYCDASYTWKEPGREMELSGILHWLEQYPGVLVEITGGEPLLQDNIHPLCERLIDRGHSLLIETNGSVSLEHVHRQAGIIMDIKCPESGMHDKLHKPNLDILQRRKGAGSRDEIKFVLSSEQDFHWARKKVEQYGLARLLPVLFSPVRDLFSPQRLAELLLKYRTPVRLQLQLHTLLWPDKTRGV